jgi:hypothetical protein
MMSLQARSKKMKKHTDIHDIAKLYLNKLMKGEFNGCNKKKQLKNQLKKRRQKQL